MKKIILSLAIMVLVIAVCFIAYAQNSLYGKLKQASETDTMNDIKDSGSKILSGIGDILSDVKEGALKVKSAVEEEIAKEAEKLAEGSDGTVSDKIKEGLPKVIDNLKEALNETPDDVKLLLKLAVAYKLGGEYSLAITVAEKILTYDPDNKEAAMIIAQSHKLKGEAEKGVAFLKDFADEKLHDPSIRAQLAALRAEIGDNENAVKDIEAAIQYGPGIAESYQKAGEIYTLSGQKGIKLFVEGKKVDFNRYSNIEPVLINGNTLIPIRALAESLGAAVEYDSQTSTVRITEQTREVILSCSRNTAKVNSKEVKLSMAPLQRDGRMLIPLRFVSEQLGREVNWYPYSKYGIISVNNKH